MRTPPSPALLRGLAAIALVTGALLGTSLGARQLSEGTGPEILTTREVPPARSGDRPGRMTEGDPAPEGMLTPREEALLEAARAARREAGIEVEVIR